MIYEKVVPVINPVELYEAEKRLTEIRFECLVKMYDCGIRQTKGMFLSAPKPLPPQWFKLANHLTLEFIKYESPEKIGLFVKNMFNQLQEAIEKYEKQ